MMFKNLCLLSAFLCAYNTNYLKAEKVILTNKILALGDGLVIDGITIGEMLQVRRLMRAIQHGIPHHETKKMEGKYTLRGHTVSLHTAARYAQQFEDEINSYTPEEAAHIRAELHALLERIKQEYLAATLPFMDQAHGVKSFMLKLIKESCKKRGRMQSFLLDWGKTREDEEVKKFNENITSLQRLDTFCTDLVNFIEDVINSCPKAWKQFQELYSHHRDML